MDLKSRARTDGHVAALQSLFRKWLLIPRLAFSHALGNTREKKLILSPGYHLTVGLARAKQRGEEGRLSLEAVGN